MLIFAVHRRMKGKDAVTGSILGAWKRRTYAVTDGHGMAERGLSIVAGLGRHHPSICDDDGSITARAGRFAEVGLRSLTLSERR